MENTHPRRLGQPPPPPFIVEPSSGQHKQSVILLHGLGNNGADFGNALLTTGLCSDGQTLAEVLPGARFIFPTSRWRRSRAFKRALLTSWFDITSLEDPYLRSHTQVQGLEESCAEVIGLVRREMDAVGARNVILGGISQGFATSLVALLLLGFPIAGYIGISGWLPFCPDMEQLLGLGKEHEDDDDRDVLGGSEDNEGFGFEKIEDKSTASSPADQVFEFVRDLVSIPETPPSTASPVDSVLSTPAFFGHGTADEKVKIEYGERAGSVLRAMGFGVESRRYQDLGHEYRVPEEIDDIVEFIRSRTGWILQD